MSRNKTIGMISTRWKKNLETLIEIDKLLSYIINIIINNLKRNVTKLEELFEELDVKPAFKICSEIWLYETNFFSRV